MTNLTDKTKPEAQSLPVNTLTQAPNTLNLSHIKFSRLEFLITTSMIKLKSIDYEFLTLR